jgi:glycosyltransferase involved in cell wall biosynthesis
VGLGVKEGVPTIGTMDRLTAIVPATNAPPTLDRCLEAIRAAADAPNEVIVVDRPANASPASARNRGAHEASGDVLVFVDADVVVHADAFTLIRRSFAEDDSLAALFGSYDDQPWADGETSAFRNLLHHHVHHSSAGEATTFWAGLGAIRRDVFEELGGFVEHPIEDIELGMRLAAAGRRVVLDPRVQGRHLKRWTLRSMVRTDLLIRGAPWVALLLRHRTGTSSLNLGWRHRFSALASIAAVAAAVLRRPPAAFAALVALVALNRGFYELLLRKRGVRGVTAGVGLHVLHHLTGIVAVPLGVLRYLRERRT